MKSRPRLTNRILIGIAAIADVSAVSALIALFLRQNTFLVLAIVVIALGVVLILSWLFQRDSVDRQNLVVLGFVCLGSIVIAVAFWASLASVRVTPIHVEVVSPPDSAKIDGYRYLVKGTVSDPNARIYVLVRSLETLDYWVQERPSVDADRNWQVNVYLGEKTTGIGENYEVMALATNENLLVTLMTGNLLRVGKTKNTPENTNRSNLVTVVRIR